MRYTLTLHECFRGGEGPDMTKWASAGYKVHGLPSGEEAWIVDLTRHWQILRMKDGIKGDWTGNYTNPEDALTVLQKEFEQ